MALCKPSSYLSVKTVDQIYKMYVRPRLDFCDVIYHPCITNPFDSSINLKYLLNTLERIQYHCALAITGAWQGTNLDKIYDQLGWESLTDRRYCRRLFHFYKIQNDLTPSYMKDPLPPLKNHPYTTRSEFVLHELKCHSDSFRNSFYPDSVRCWNRLDHLLPDSPNIQSFKNVFLLIIDLLLEVYLVFTIHLVLSVSFNCVWGLALYLSTKTIIIFLTPLQTSVSLVIVRKT